MYIYVDYIQIHTITIFNDLFCMDGAYRDPLTSKLKFTYFEADFSYFYNLLTEICCERAEAALSEISLAVSGNRNSDIDLEENFIEVGCMVFRLTTLVNYHDEKEVGFFMEDSYLLEDDFRFERNLVPPILEGWDRADRVKLLRAHRRLEGHLTVVCLRYAYFDCKLKSGVSEEQALFDASLTNPDVFLIAKAAYEYISPQTLFAG